MSRNKSQTSAGEIFLLGMFVGITGLNVLLFGESLRLYEGAREFLGYSYLVLGTVAVINAWLIYKS